MRIARFTRGRARRLASLGAAATLACALAAAGNARTVDTEAASQQIRVRGHWTIIVVDPDGTVVEHREFDNALQTTGEDILTALLGRQETPGGWQIRTFSNASVEVCEEPAGTPSTVCTITETTDTLTGNSVFSNLTLAVAGGPPHSFTLSGNLIAQLDGQVNAVNTRLQSCPSSVTPANCPTTGPFVQTYEFTSTTLATPVSVTTGQQVLVTVEISFS